MNHWVFVIRDDKIVFEKRIKAEKWPLYPATKFRKYLKIGDKIIFYQAGKYGQQFLGTAEVKSKVKPIPNKIDYYIDIDRIDIWKKQPSIRNIISKLSFIKNKGHWGLYLQGGILKMNRVDHAIILKESEKLKTKK